MKETELEYYKRRTNELFKAINREVERKRAWKHVAEDLYEIMEQWSKTSVYPVFSASEAINKFKELKGDR